MHAFARPLALPAALLLALAITAPAMAHAELVSSDPQDNGVLATPPTVITLTFSEGLDQAKSQFKLVGPDGGTVGTGKAAKDGGQVMTLDGLALGPGAYTIKWTSAAQDGHLDRGTLSFAVSEPTPAPATPAPTPAPTVAASEAASAPPSAASSQAPASAPAPGATAAVASPTASAAPDPTPAGGSGTDALIPIAVGLVLVAGVGAFLMRRSRRA